MRKAMEIENPSEFFVRFFEQVQRGFGLTY